MPKQMPRADPFLSCVLNSLRSIERAGVDDHIHLPPRQKRFLKRMLDEMSKPQAKVSTPETSITSLIQRERAIEPTIEPTIEPINEQTLEQKNDAQQKQPIYQ